MTDMLNQAISSDDPEEATKIIQNALGIESDDVANYCFPKKWPPHHEHRARLRGGTEEAVRAAMPVGQNIRQGKPRLL